MEFTIIIIWLIGSLLIASCACIAAKHFGHEFLVGMFVGGVMIAGAVVQKVVEIGPFITSAGIVAFSIIFLVTDTLSEFWGKKRAQKTVLSGFLVYGMFVFTTQIALHLPYPPFWEFQEAFEVIFGSSWRIMIASLVAYIVAQSWDVWMFHYWKKKTNGKYLWLRNNVSTFTSQFLDTIIFFSIAFYGIFPLFDIIIGTIFLKWVIALIDTPFMYFIRWYYLNVGKPFKIKNVEKNTIPII